MVPLLARIERQLAVTTDPGKRGELFAERACYLARVGEFEGAQKILDELRDHFKDSDNVRVSALLMLADGLLDFFARTSVRSLDRVRRAYAVSQAFHCQDVAHLSAAWLAHIELNRVNYLPLSPLLNGIYASIKNLSPAADLRASIVIADAFMTFGDDFLARQWYERSRRMAVSLGDESAIASIIYNRAVLTINRLMIRSCRAEIVLPDAEAAFMEISSAKSFHLATRHASMFQFVEIAEARCLLLLRNFDAASNIFERFVGQSLLSFGYTSERPLTQVEFAFCLSELGRPEAALAVFRSIDLSCIAEMAADDEFQFWHLYRSLAEKYAEDSRLAAARIAACSAQMLSVSTSLSKTIDQFLLPAPL